MTNNQNKKFVELIWNEKYEKFGRCSNFEKCERFKECEKMPIEKPNLPFQPVETINLPRVRGGTQQTLFGKNWPENYPKDWKNLLIWGDNKLVMSSLLKQGWAGKINLIYIDPPFFTGADFSFKTKIGNEEVVKEQSIIEERAYRDTWSGGIASYLKYMYERLALMRELLSENGSIYVHCDWHIGHYLKIIMDEIFGYDNFVNEIIWFFRGTTSSTKMYGDKHDTILYYAKNQGQHIFNADAIRIPYKDLSAYKQDKEGKWYKQWTKEKRYYPPQKFVNGKWILLGKYRYDVITDVPSMATAHGDEYLGLPTQKKEDLLKIFILASSNPGDIVADFFSGTGTTLVVAEKLDRRWIGCDLSKFMIHLSRKRLLDIHNSKDLLDEKKKNYGKPARPFEIWNVGNYETVYWQERLEEYLTFMLKLYQAQPITGFKYLHGKKGDRIVHVASLNAPVTMDEVEKVILECRTNGFNKADILGWDWNYEVNELAKELAKKNGVDLRLIQIPSINEIKSALAGFDLKLLKIPEQVIEKELLPHVRFHEVAVLELESKVKGKQVTIKISDFQIPPTKELDEIKDKIKKFSDLIDYWSVDWNYKGDTFYNQWQSYRTKKEPNIELEAKHTYKERGKYRIMVKVVDVFGNDANNIIEVDVK